MFCQGASTMLGEYAMVEEVPILLNIAVSAVNAGLAGYLGSWLGVAISLAAWNR